MIATAEPAAAVAEAGTPWWVLLVVAFVGAVGAISAAWITRSTRRENRIDHGEVKALLENMTDGQHRIEGAVVKLDEQTDKNLRRLHQRIDKQNDRMDDHMKWHIDHPENGEGWDGEERRSEPRD